MLTEKDAKKRYVIIAALILAVAAITFVAAFFLGGGSFFGSGAAGGVIELDGDSVRITGEGAYEEDGNVYVISGGDYTVKGELSDGSLIVDDEYETSTIRLHLSGARIHCDKDAAIRVNNAKDVVIDLSEGTGNFLSGGEEYSGNAEDDGTGGVIFSHDDLEIGGLGSLEITAKYKHGIECNDRLVISGGKITISAPRDGINANDGVDVSGGELFITAEDDGISAGKAFLMTAGKIGIDNCYEGIEALTVDIRDGDIDIYCTDDGINANGQEAAGPDAKDGEETWIRVSGGNITVRNDMGMDCDGFDSNGDIDISGGNIRISLSGSGTNCALDWGSERGGVCTVSGGTVIACGGSPMVEAFDEASTQCGILYINNDGTDDGDIVAVKDDSNDTVLEWEVPTGFTAVQMSSPDLKIGRSYTIVFGKSEETVMIEEVSSQFGEKPQGFGKGPGPGFKKGPVNSP